MGDEPRPAGDNPARQPSAEGLSNPFSVRDVEQQFRTEATDFWHSVGHQFSSHTVAEQLLQSYGALPATTFNIDDSTNVTVQGRLAERRGHLDGSSDYGTLTMDVQGRQDPNRMLGMWGPRYFSYDVNAVSTDKQSQLHVWTDAANRSPNVNLTAQVFDNVRLTYRRDAEARVAGLNYDGSSDRGLFTGQLRAQPVGQSTEILPRLANLSYDINAGSPDNLNHFRVWSDRADRPPHFNVGAQVLGNIGVVFQRDVNNERIGLQADLGGLKLTASDAVRQHHFSLSAVRDIRDRLHFGVNFNQEERRDSWGFKIIIGAPDR